MEGGEFEGVTVPNFCPELENLATTMGFSKLLDLSWKIWQFLSTFAPAYLETEFPLLDLRNDILNIPS